MGVYTAGGEIIIEKEAEDICGYRLSNKALTEIKGHITRSCYHKPQDFIERYCLIPATSQIEETRIIPPNKTLRKIPNSSSFSRVIKNEGCNNKKIESPTAIGDSIIEEMERVT